MLGTEHGNMRMIEEEMWEGYRALAEENHALAEQGVRIDNETWLDDTVPAEGNLAETKLSSAGIDSDRRI